MNTITATKLTAQNNRSIKSVVKACINASSKHASDLAKINTTLIKSYGKETLRLINALEINKQSIDALKKEFGLYKNDYDRKNVSLMTTCLSYYSVFDKPQQKMFIDTLKDTQELRQVDAMMQANNLKVPALKKLQKAGLIAKNATVDKVTIPSNYIQRSMPALALSLKPDSLNDADIVKKAKTIEKQIAELPKAKQKAVEKVVKQAASRVAKAEQTALINKKQGSKKTPAKTAQVNDKFVSVSQEALAVSTSLRGMKGKDAIMTDALIDGLLAKMAVIENYFSSH